MKMSEWDKLWNSDTRKEVWTAEHDWFIGDWVAEVKAEGDRLNREGLEHYAIAVEYYEKLEAIKTYLKEGKMVIYDPYNRYSAQFITHTQGMLLLAKLLEILEDLEFTTNSEEVAE